MAEMQHTTVSQMSNFTENSDLSVLACVREIFLDCFIIHPSRETQSVQGWQANHLTAKHLSEWKRLDTNIHVWNYITPIMAMLVSGLHEATGGS